MISGPLADELRPRRLLPLTLASCVVKVLSGCVGVCVCVCVCVFVCRYECVCHVGVDCGYDGNVRRQLAPITYLHLLVNRLEMKHPVAPSTPAGHSSTQLLDGGCPPA